MADAAAATPPPLAELFSNIIAECDLPNNAKCVKRLEDVFEYGYGCPNNPVASFEAYRTLIRNKYGKPPQSDINKDVKDVYCVITYPFKHDYIFKFTICPDAVMTYESILFAYTMAMRFLATDNEPATHDIEDLVYNGGSYIEFYNTHVVCEFDCDS